MGTAIDQPSADEALQRLLDGNKRFLNGTARFSTVRKEVLAELARVQRPYATVLGCSDSRVPPELLFDVGFGELFIIRVAGNVISPEIKGSLQYAGSHLCTPLFIVLGHENCGAVKAALDCKFKKSQQHTHIQNLIDTMLPGMDGLSDSVPEDQLLIQGVEANVRWSMNQILNSPEGKARVAEGKYKLVGAVCDLETGRIRILDIH